MIFFTEQHYKSLIKIKEEQDEFARKKILEYQKKTNESRLAKERLSLLKFFEKMEDSIELTEYKSKKESSFVMSEESKRRLYPIQNIKEHDEHWKEFIKSRSI